MFLVELIVLVAGVAFLIFVKTQTKIKKGYGIFTAWCEIMQKIIY